MTSSKESTGYLGESGPSVKSTQLSGHSRVSCGPQMAPEHFGPTKQSHSPKLDGMEAQFAESVLVEEKLQRAFLQAQDYLTALDLYSSARASLSKLEKLREHMTTSESTGKSETTTPGYRMTIYSIDGKVNISLSISQESLSSMKRITLDDMTLRELSVLRDICRLIHSCLSSSLQALSSRAE